MNTKEKLEMLWKYLTLIFVAALGFTWLDSAHFSRGHKKGEYIFIDEKDHGFFDGKPMDVTLEKEIVNGDTTIQVSVNGKPVDAEKLKELNGILTWSATDGKEYVFQINGHEGKRLKIIIEDTNALHEDEKKTIIRKRIRNHGQ